MLHRAHIRPRQHPRGPPAASWRWPWVLNEVFCTASRTAQVNTPRASSVLQAGQRQLSAERRREVQMRRQRRLQLHSGAAGRACLRT
ncbi:hypothetical protein NQL31_000674 [Lotmaria passim]